MECIGSSGSGNKDRSGNEDASTADYPCPFSDYRESVAIFAAGSFCVPSSLTEDGKERRNEAEDPLRQ